MPEQKSVTMCRGRVVRRETPCREHFALTIAVPDFPVAAPGQFVQIRCSEPPRDEPEANAASAEAGWKTSRNQHGLLLRRPFSLGGQRFVAGQSEIRVLARIVGEGTRYLAALAEGAEVDLIGPLGTPFTLPRAGQRAILVAGGVGLPPIQWLGETLRRQNVGCELIYGAQSRTLLPLPLTAEPSAQGDFTLCAEPFATWKIPVAITTDDGSCGLSGHVTDRLAGCLAACRAPAEWMVYACGPHAMLKVVAALCIQHGVAGELAMERTMGCGLGTCQSCVVKVKEEASTLGWRYALCCKEGPVFPASSILWD